jgi:hypothetical protein
MTKFLKSILPVVAVISFVSAARAQTVVFVDGEFNTADWSFGTILTPGAGASANRSSSGGNVGSYLRLTLSMSAGDGAAKVWGLNTTSIYAPSTQGAIESIAYAEDVLEMGSPQASGAVLSQNGLLYYRFTDVAAGSSWTTYNAPPATASDYTIFSGQSNGTNRVHPDFSVDGDPITFGFYRDIGGTALTDFTTISGLDNWTTTVNVVPEPSTDALLLFSGAASIYALKRRRG